jgi:hypothetical protein
LRKSRSNCYVKSSFHLFCYKFKWSSYAWLSPTIMHLIMLIPYFSHICFLIIRLTVNIVKL